MKPIVTILRGLPGSGKSTYARARKTGLATIVSADEYFHLVPNDGAPREELRGAENPGPYIFNPAELGFAHARCFRLFIEAVQANAIVFVDNTNSTPVEIAPYILGAQAYGADVSIIRVVAPIDVCLARQTHGAPEHVLRAMAVRLDEPLPPWWPREIIVGAP